MIEATILELANEGLGPKFLTLREQLRTEVLEAKRRPDAISIRSDLCLNVLRYAVKTNGAVGAVRLIGAVEIACAIWDEGGGSDDTGSVG